YKAPLLLDKLDRFIPRDALRIIGITDIDIYDEGLNFIFGEARGKACIISENRFRPCGEIKEKNVREKVFDRVIKTVVHELGHTFGLKHCKKKECVMYFSNWVRDTDRKSKYFCSFHSNKLKRQGIPLAKKIVNF
ncbi:MAG: matrixin family metalloprotease, partial [Atribacterota bacterium]